MLLGVVWRDQLYVDGEAKRSRCRGLCALKTDDAKTAQVMLYIPTYLLHNAAPRNFIT